MFNLGFSEIIVLGIIALIFIGPKELPEIARVIGRFINDLKRTTGDIGKTVMKPDEDIMNQLADLKKRLEEKIEDPLQPSQTDHDRGLTQLGVSPVDQSEAVVDVKKGSGNESV